MWRIPGKPSAGVLERCMSSVEGKNWKPVYDRCVKARTSCLGGELMHRRSFPSPARSQYSRVTVWAAIPPMPIPSHARRSAKRGRCEAKTGAARLPPPATAMDRVSACSARASRCRACSAPVRWSNAPAAPWRNSISMAGSILCAGQLRRPGHHAYGLFRQGDDVRQPRGRPLRSGGPRSVLRSVLGNSRYWVPSLPGKAAVGDLEMARIVKAAFGGQALALQFPRQECPSRFGIIKRVAAFGALAA